jgi:quercetin dioxygenase-like cupin family protein
MNAHTDQARAPRIIEPGAGRHLHFLNHLATIKVEGGDDAALSVVEFTGARSFGPPLHRHREEDELFVILDGEIAFHTEQDRDERMVASSGGIAFLPKGIAHTFQVLSETARWVCVTGSGTAHPRFDRMVTALGEPTDDATLPEPGEIDAARVAEVCLEHGIEVVGPPPAPLP